MANSGDSRGMSQVSVTGEVQPEGVATSATSDIGLRVSGPQGQMHDFAVVRVPDGGPEVTGFTPQYRKLARNQGFTDKNERQ